MTMLQFTLRPGRGLKTGWTVLDAAGKTVGHIGLMSGGSCTFINGANKFGFGYVSHSNTPEAALAEFTKHANEAVNGERK